MCQTLCRCSLVCKAWPQKATKYLSVRVSIHSVEQLLQYDKVVKFSHSVLHSLSIDIPQRFTHRGQSCSVIGSTILLISKLSNLRQLDIECHWHNDHHPRILKLLSNTSVQFLSCIFFIHTSAIRQMIEFITHFRSLQHLSLRICRIHESSRSQHNQPNSSFQRLLPKTKICLKELHLDIRDAEVLKLVVDAFIRAKDFASHICKQSYIEWPRSQQYKDVYRDLLAHCSSSLQDCHLEVGDIDCDHDVNESRSLTFVSLHGCNNIRKLQYRFSSNELAKLHKHLQTVSSSLISEVHFTYEERRPEPRKSWTDIENLMIHKFPSLSYVTIEWNSFREMTPAYYFSRCNDALPKLCQKGILRPILPPQGWLK